MNYKLPVLLSLFLLAGLSQAIAQPEILDKIFSQEEPVFQSTILPTTADGAAKVVVYFTHSKISALETSFWITDNGADLSGNGAKKLLRGLQEMGNRQQDTLLVQGLVNGHYYSIGVDYRPIGGMISRKFSSKPLQINYLYNSNPEAVAQTAPATQPQEKQQPTPTSPTTTTPCISPDLFVRIDPAGYCGTDDLPAVLVQCESCQSQEWEFSVETRTERGEWRPLRADGQRQKASGTLVRTEPLCVLPDGSYYIRVLGWGKNCPIPVVQNVATPVQIQAAKTQPIAKSGTPQTYEAPSVIGPSLPDTCIVTAEAVLNGNIITGTLELAANSPCGTMEPYAMVKYVHPGFRDIELKPVPLNYGIPVPFEIRLTSYDLERGIHPINVTTFIKTGTENLPMGAFWTRATVNDPNAVAATNTNNVPAKIQQQPVQQTQTGGAPKIVWDEPQTPPQKSPEPQQPTTDYYSPRQSTHQPSVTPADLSADAGQTQPPVSPQPEPYESSIWEQDIETVSVTASDPNCTQIQDLQLVYNPRQPNEPLYISWLNPRCCQEEGCEYTVWTGRTPDQLKLLIKGRKQGAVIREVLQGLDAQNQYFEVVVKTSNGSRKAAYVPGEGAKYGFEEILAYRDKSNAPTSDTLVFTKGGDIEPQPQQYEASTMNTEAEVEIPTVQVRRSAPAGFKWDNEPAKQPTLTAKTPEPISNKPTRPITDFAPCKIQRKTVLETKTPIHEGDEVRIKYDFADKDYRFTLYQLPQNATEWIIAPGTQEGQAEPVFELEVQPLHSGKYLILTHKANSNWGCLSAPMTSPVELNVIAKQ